MKLLLVDDDAFLRDMYATKFTEAKHDVSVVKSGEEALILLDQGEAFDVIVMDMVMPGITGVELLKKIKKIGSGETAKCVILSNQGEQSDIQAATAAGAVGYIVKAESIPSQVVKKIEELAA